MAEKKSRRALFGSIAVAAGSYTLGGLTAGSVARGAAQDDQANPPQVDCTWPWRYFSLDPKKVAARAYDLYPEGSCMYAVGAAIITELAETHGEPYASFPVDMMRFGHGGVAGWGTICGTLNGAGNVFGLFVKDKEECELLIDELFDWYRGTAQPVYIPEGGEAIRLVEPRSVLCHVSSIRWCEKAGKYIKGLERKERCRRLSASVAAKTVMLLNAYAVNQVPEKRHLSAMEDPGDPAISKMNCAMCHGREDDEHEHEHERERERRHGRDD